MMTLSRCDDLKIGQKNVYTYYIFRDILLDAAMFYNPIIFVLQVQNIQLNQSDKPKQQAGASGDTKPAQPPPQPSAQPSSQPSAQPPADTPTDNATATEGLKPNSFSGGWFIYLYIYLFLVNPGKSIQ